MGLFQGFLSAWVGIPSFVVTLAGLLGFQGLMLKILGIHGAINVREPFIRGITTITLPPFYGWLGILLLIGIFIWFLFRNRTKRKIMGLELNPPLNDVFK